MSRLRKHDGSIYSITYDGVKYHSHDYTVSFGEEILRKNKVKFPWESKSPDTKIGMDIYKLVIKNYTLCYEFYTTIYIVPDFEEMPLDVYQSRLDALLKYVPENFHDFIKNRLTEETYEAKLDQAEDLVNEFSAALKKK